MASSSDFLKVRQIKYLNRDFQSFKRDLIKFSQAHHSGVFQDFNESSVGMALLEFPCYIGDVLSYYQDYQFNELKQQSARQIENVVSFAKSLGYRPLGKRAAHTLEAFFVEVPATTDTLGNVVPNEAYSPALMKGSKVSGPGGVYETLDDVFFSSSLDRSVTGSRYDSSTGLPTHFALRKDVEIAAGETVTDSFTVNDFVPFKTIELTQPDVIEVVSVVDADGNEWFEVDYLAQETVFDAVLNPDPDNDVVPYILRLLPAPRRFITDRDPLTAKTSLIFGSGDGLNFDDQLIPNLADLSLPLAGRRTFTTFALDPQNFLKTRGLGLSPFNTSLTIKYRVGGGSQTNAPARTIKTVVDAKLDFSSTSLDPPTMGAVKTSIECVNPSPAIDGAPEETIPEIKANSAAFFAAQNRVVTREDFIARILTLPAKFGKPEKVYVKRNRVSALSHDIHILSKDANGHLTTASDTLKNNIRTYLTAFRMLTDGVNLLDADILNLRVNFGIVVTPRFRAHPSEVLTKCIAVIREYLDVDRTQIAQPISISDLQSKIQGVLGVVSVFELRFTNVFGDIDKLPYSDVRFDVTANTKNNILYCPENSIFEVKYPSRDIVGVSK